MGGPIVLIALPPVLSQGKGLVRPGAAANIDLEHDGRLFRTLLGSPALVLGPSPPAHALPNVGLRQPLPTKSRQSEDPASHHANTGHKRISPLAADVQPPPMLDRAGTQLTPVLDPKATAVDERPMAPKNTATRSHPLDRISDPQALSGAAFLPPLAQPVEPAVNSLASVPDPGPSFAELMERHVRSTLLSVNKGGTSTAEVRLELSDAVLPGVSLALRRVPGGWQMAAVSDNRQSLQRLTRFAPVLVKRFAAASLGSLEIVTDLGFGATATSTEE
jgi:hypothetical protein